MFSQIDSGYTSGPDDWVDLLNCLSRENEYGKVNETYSPRDDWQVIEDRLLADFAMNDVFTDKKVPDSYLHFMMVTNGKYKLSMAGPSDDSNFLPVASILYFKDGVGEDVIFWNDSKRKKDNENYYVYGVTKDGRVRGDYIEYDGCQVEGLISIGYVDGDGFIALNPREVSRDGEWETWYLDWKALGVWRFRSFAELMQNLSYRETKRPLHSRPYGATLLRHSCASKIQTAALFDE